MCHALLQLFCVKEIVMTSLSSKPRVSWQPTASRRQALFYLGVLVAFLGASSAPTPLYPLYQSLWGFSSTLLTLVFAVYMFALLAALLISGSLSDHWGRKPVIGVAMALEMLSLLAFLLATGPVWLVGARILQGIATGVVTSAVVAAILDSDARRGALIASVAPLFGMAFGALFSGLLVAYAPAPMQLVFALLLGVLMLQLAWLPKMTETVITHPQEKLSLRPHVSIPASVRTTLLRVVTVSIAAWMLGGFALSLGPSLVAELTGLYSPVLGALPIFFLSLVGAAAMLVLRRKPPRLALIIGGWGLAIGMMFILLGIYQHAFGLLLTGATAAGVGFGAGFMGVMRTVTPLVAAPERSAVMAALYVIWYLSASVPALVAGMATDIAGVEMTTYAYGVIVVLLALTSLAGIFSRRPGRQPAVCPDA